jgi:hypothetical protein
MVNIPAAETRTNGVARIGAQPIALAAIVLVLIVVSAGSGSPGVRAAGREDQGPGIVAAGFDRSAAGRSGSIANRQAAARGTAGRYQAAVRSGQRTHRRHRRPAAVVRKCPFCGGFKPALAAQNVIPAAAAYRQGTQARQDSWLSRSNSVRLLPWRHRSPLLDSPAKPQPRNLSSGL